MIWRWRPKIIFPPSNSPSFAALHLRAPPINPVRDANPQKPPGFKPARSNREHMFPSPHTVLTFLHNCTSDLIALRFFIWCARQPHYFHDKPAFRHMVSVVSNLTHRHGTVRGILGELEAVGCATKAQTLLLLMRIYWRGGMYDMVLESFEEMNNYGYVPQTHPRNIIMDVLFKIEHVDAALKVLEETQVPNFLSFNIAICNLSRLNDADNVRSVLRRMLRRGYYMNPDTHTLVLNCFCKSARLDEALQLLGMMIVLGLPVSMNSWSILINGFCKSGKVEFAAYLLEKMVKIGCSPNIVAYTSLIKGFLEHQTPGKAFETIAILESKGCFPDLVLCNVLIDCLSKMGWFNDAFEIFLRLGELKLTPDVYTFSSLVSTICLSRQYVHLPLLISGLSVQPDLVVCNCLLSYFCKAGYPDGAVEFYNDMLDRGILPDKYSFAAVLHALCRVGRTQEAVNVYHGILRISTSVDAHVHTVIIDGLIKSGRLHQAMNVFMNVAAGKFPLDVVTYAVAIGGLIRGGQMKKAYALFNQMKEVDIMPNGQVYNLLLSGFCKCRDVNMVNCLLQEMIDQNIEIDLRTYRSMNKLLCSSSKSHLASSHVLELSNSRLPKNEQLTLVNEFGHFARANFGLFSVSRDELDLSTSSSDDLSDLVASVG